VDDTDRLRYSRHLLLSDWPETAQERLMAAHALVIGAGGLGSAALMYLAGAGVGRITVVDPDVVELSNLQRQVLHTHSRIGQAKVLSAQATLAALNPQVQVQALAQAADAALLAQWLPGVDVVLDGTDRFATRHVINRACRQAGVPLVWAAALQFDGQLGVSDPRDAQSPCYACLFPAPATSEEAPEAAPEDTPCATLGVFAPLVGMVGVMQAGEAIKLLAGLSGHEPLGRRMLTVDGRSWQTRSWQAQRQPGCLVCAGL
jgi:molybdopterin-synthase adenylyltransferase